VFESLLRVMVECLTGRDQVTGDGFGIGLGQRTEFCADRTVQQRDVDVGGQFRLGDAALTGALGAGGPICVLRPTRARGARTRLGARSSRTGRPVRASTC